MKKILAVAMLALLTLSTIVEARASFSGSRSSFSSSRSYSSPSRSYNRPSYSAPRPVTRPVIRKTTVVQQNITQNTTSGGMGFFGTLLATGAGSYIGNRLAQPSEQPQVAPQYPLCPQVIPAGWNTPCIPQQQSQGK